MSFSNYSRDWDRIGTITTSVDACVGGHISVDCDKVILYSKAEPDKIGQVYTCGGKSPIILVDWRKNKWDGDFVYILHEDKKSEAAGAAANVLIATRESGIITFIYAQPEDYANFPNSAPPVSNTSVRSLLSDSIGAKVKQHRDAEKAQKEQEDAETKAKEEAEKSRLINKTETVRNTTFDPKDASSMIETLSFIKSNIDEETYSKIYSNDSNELRDFRKAALTKYSEVLLALKTFYNPNMVICEETLAQWRKNDSRRKRTLLWLILIPLVVLIIGLLFI